MFAEGELDGRVGLAELGLAEDSIDDREAQVIGVLAGVDIDGGEAACPEFAQGR